ncbi:MAG: helix-turn-helix transcriptional regulator [Armatimonadetes bacterium]|nr:helix-turn-helix transcriptional regulator [Armatimonadota bacterium]
MSQSRQEARPTVLVRFWSLDHHRAEAVLWTTSPWDKVVYSLEGTLHVETENELHVLPSNRALFVPAHVCHPARTLGKACVRTIFFAPQISVRRTSGVFEVRPLFRELIAEACRIGPLEANSPHHHALATMLQAEVESAHSVPTSISMPRSPWLHQWAQGFLNDPLATPDPGFSRRTLERKILAETGLSLGRWMQQARALIGLQALSSGCSVAEAAHVAGFETTSGFVQAFRRQCGTTPGKLLRQRG